MRYSTIVGSVLLSLICCGRGHEVQPPSLQETLASFEEAIAEARNELTESQRPSEVDDEEDSRRESGANGNKLARPVHAVVAAAQSLATFAAGNPHEAEAQAIQADALELAKKAGGKMTAAEFDQAIQQILSKDAALKAKL